MFWYGVSRSFWLSVVLNAGKVVFHNHWLLVGASWINHKIRARTDSELFGFGLMNHRHCAVSQFWSGSGYIWMLEFLQAIHKNSLMLANQLNSVPSFRRHTCAFLLQEADVLAAVFSIIWDITRNGVSISWKRKLAWLVQMLEAKMSCVVSKYQGIGCSNFLMNSLSISQIQNHKSACSGEVFFNNAFSRSIQVSTSFDSVSIVPLVKVRKGSIAKGIRFISCWFITSLKEGWKRARISWLKGKLRASSNDSIHMLGTRMRSYEFADSPSILLYSCAESAWVISICILMLSSRFISALSFLIAVLSTKWGSATESIPFSTSSCETWVTSESGMMLASVGESWLLLLFWSDITVHTGGLITEFWRVFLFHHKNVVASAIRHTMITITAIHHAMSKFLVLVMLSWKKKLTKV